MVDIKHGLFSLALLYICLVSCQSVSPDVEPGSEPDEEGIGFGISSMNVGQVLSNSVSEDEGVEIDGIVWQHENAGSASVSPGGRLYQWGRSAGQLYGQSDIIVSSGPVSVPDDSEKSFYAVSSDPFDWTLSQDDLPWKQNPVCPEGWRLPTEDEMRSLCMNYSGLVTHQGRKGRWFSGTNPYSDGVKAVFFPAAGSMGYLDGKAVKTGEEGWYWTSSTSGSYAAALYFHDQSTAVGYYFRARGMSVRCCSEGQFKIL